MNQTIKQLCSVMFDNHAESLHLSNHKALDWAQAAVSLKWLIKMCDSHPEDVH